MASHQQPAPPVIRQRSVPSRRRRDGLIRYATDVNSQNGEDGILKRLFELLPAAPNSQEDCRWCVDVGAWDGVHLSNTRQLLASESNDEHPHPKLPWRGVLLEADEDRHNDLVQLYSGSQNHCLRATVSATSEHDPNNLHHLLQNSAPELPNHFDFLCIDIDGSDYWVLYDFWTSTASPYHASVVCIEFNPTMPDDLIYIPSRDDTVRHGASLAALVELALTHDYVLVETTLYNAFFVPRSLYETYLKEEVPDTSIEALHEITMGTSLYQLYDGTLKLWGCKKLLWHRKPMDESKLQVLPTHQRTFPFAPAPYTGVNDGSTTMDDKVDVSKAIDVSSYCCKEDASTSSDTSTGRSSAQRRQDCAAALVRQLRADGFCLVRGTHVSPATCQHALQATQALLHDAPEQVRRSCLTMDRARRGYSPPNVENFASLAGVAGPNDLVRKFRIGPLQQQQPQQQQQRIRKEGIKHDDDESAKIPENGDDSYNSASATEALLRHNVWPSEEAWDGPSAAMFRTKVEAYYRAACEAAHQVVHAICDGLFLVHPELAEALEPLVCSAAKADSESIHTDKGVSSDRTTSILTLLGYRAGTRHKGKKKSPLVAAHTDVGVITMLLFDGGTKTCASLQRSDKQGGWVDVNLPYLVPEDPVFVVNIADCFSELTKGLVPSTVHRVVARRESVVPRSCCALFVGLDPAVQLQFGQKRMTYEEWRKQRIAKAQSVLRASTRSAT